jgi:ADP-ribose pyrophosphatase YjhB (NUDIX family)
MPKLLSKKLFLKSFEYSPRLAVCIILKNPRGEILLTKRGIPPYKGSWHYPGGFLLRDEKIKDCLVRISKKEFGFKVDTNKMKLLGIFENLKGDPRGHVIDVLYEYKVRQPIKLTPNKETEESGFFKKLPRKIAFGHRIVLGKLGFRD